MEEQKKKKKKNHDKKGAKRKGKKKRQKKKKGVGSNKEKRGVRKFGTVTTLSRAQTNCVWLPIPLVINRTGFFFLCSRSRLIIWFRGTGSAVPSRVILLILHNQAESGAHSRDSSRFPPRRPHRSIPSTSIRSDPSLSGHAIADQWCSLPRVRRHRASSPQGIRVTGAEVFQISTMDPILCASLFPHPLLV